MPEAASPPVVLPVTEDQDLPRAISVSSLLAVPTANPPLIVPRKQNPADQMTDHLQRCMKSVQELAMTISCALATLQGHEKTGSSDIHGSYARLSIAMAQLPTHVHCDQCKQSVLWSHFDPTRSGIGRSEACKCKTPTPPHLRDSCGNPASAMAYHGGCDIGRSRSEPLMMSHLRAQLLHRASQGYELDHTAVAG